MSENRKLAMYDVRGIQDYIYKTERVKDAIGASAIVETIIQDALQEAVRQEKLTSELEWFDETGVMPYEAENVDVQVLYIGGGNAFVSYADGEICSHVNKRMSRYVLEHTYSLQLAIAVVDQSENYAVDYDNIFKAMVKVKDDMEVSRPFGALPIMDVEVKTGLPVYPEAAGESRETRLKKEMEKKITERMRKAREFDRYVEGKGVDSTIAVVHIDGNNMGLRIRNLISGVKDYTQAVNRMREISYRINQSYKKVYTQMEEEFEKIEKNSVLKILTAGDDITYVCKGKYALETVASFSEKIGKQMMYEDKTKTDEDNLNRYGFSVCAGVAYIRSHFPFFIGYEVAEACCDSAKDAAKTAENMLHGDGFDKIGNWVDFQICKNVHTGDLEKTRRIEYVTSKGEQLLLRPYELPLLDLEARKDARNRYEVLRKNIEFFQDEKKLPHSHAKKLRNLYSAGRELVEEFAAFLRSRGFHMPDQTLDMYSKDGQALWYDALEIFDCFKCIDRGEEQ